MAVTFDLDAVLELDYADPLGPDEVATFTSVAECPLDPEDTEDGDDALLANGPLPDEVAGPPRTATLMPIRKIVMFHREVRRGMKGNDCLAIKRAMRKAGYGKKLAFRKKYRYRFGVQAAWQLKRFQKKHGLRADGVYGPTTHKKLAHYFDTYGAWLLAHSPPAGDTKAELRKKIVANAIFGYNNRWLIHYTQSGHRMYGVRNHVHMPHIPYYEDCSSFVTWCYYAAGAHDPNGLGYNGQGYTGTLGNHGHRTSNPQPADLNLYGYSPWHHTTIEIGGGRVISHGSEIGPLLVTRRYRTDYNETVASL